MRDKLYLIFKDILDLFFWFLLLILVSILISLEFFFILFYFILFFIEFFVKFFLNYFFFKKVNPIQYKNFFNIKNIYFKFFLFIFYEFPIK